MTSCGDDDGQVGRHPHLLKNFDFAPRLTKQAHCSGKEMDFGVLPEENTVMAGRPASATPIGLPLPSQKQAIKKNMKHLDTLHVLYR